MAFNIIHVMSPYIYQSATQLAAAIRSGQASSADVVAAHLNRIQQFNARFNALISVFEEEAMAEARLCDEEAGRGQFRGPLHGVPITIKEAFWIKGRHSTMNFRVFKNFVAPQDAVVVERIRQSGAIILGQSNVPRNLIDCQVTGDIYPEAKNPYNEACTPGGSTGGGAAALAAGLSPLELGSDFGGSVRVPAAFCGLYGLKPTERTVPVHGNTPLPKNHRTYLMHMSQAGPLARSVDDIEVIWRTIVGPHPGDRNIPDIHWKAPTGTQLSCYKIAWTDGWPGFESSNPVKQLLQTLAGQLADAGCSMHKQIPGNNLHHDSLQTYTGLFPYVISQGTPWYVRSVIKLQLNRSLLRGIDAELGYLRKPMNKAFQLNANHYGEVMLQRNQVTQRWEQFFEEFDFLLCPVAFGPAYPRGKTGDRLQYDGTQMAYLKYVWPYVACFNASGNPALTVPAGTDPSGLPLGVQIVTRYWNEPEMLHFARMLQPMLRPFEPPVW